MKAFTHPLQATYDDAADQELIAAALAGDRQGLAALVEQHQAFIYNVALKMRNNVPDAQDATQEILLKLITNLGKYDPTKGRFRTWLYRVAFNHLLNVQRNFYERSVTSFDGFFNMIDSVPDEALAPHEEAELALAVEESKTACMAGMLMCLDRQQRLTYIVGEVFEIEHRLAAEIFEISPANFRQRLSRARKDLYQWMHRRCGLVNRANPCRCPKKTKGFVQRGWVEADGGKWNSDFTRRIGELTTTKTDEALRTIDDLYARLYREHPFKIAPSATAVWEEVIRNPKLEALFGLWD